MDFEMHQWGALMDLLEKGLHERIVGIAQKAHAARSWLDLGDQFEALGRQLGSGAGQSGEIAVWARKIGDQLRRDWIACHHDDGNVARRILRRIDGRGLYRDEDIDLAANQFRSQLRQTSVLALRGSNLELDILPLDISKLAERLTKRPQGFWPTAEKNANAPHLIDLLRVRRQRPSCCTDKNTNKFPPFHARSYIHNVAS
jgi:hypothetical protein